MSNDLTVIFCVFICTHFSFVMAQGSDTRLPVTILTGFLGAGTKL